MENREPVREIKFREWIFRVEPLHKVPYLVDECCDLINLEWKRSHVARLRSIGSSSEDFPISLVLVRNSGEPRVIGHCKLSKISLSASKIFVETVVIHPDFRGHGLGKFLMQQAEVTARRKNVKFIYLSTQGQEVFYEKLGYTKCPPINIYGFQLNDSNENENINEITQMTVTLQLKSNLNNNAALSKNAPPPPPPPLPAITNRFYCSNLSTSKTFMMKEIIY